MLCLLVSGALTTVGGYRSPPKCVRSTGAAGEGAQAGPCKFQPHGASKIASAQTSLCYQQTCMQAKKAMSEVRAAASKAHDELQARLCAMQAQLDAAKANSFASTEVPDCSWLPAG